MRVWHSTLCDPLPSVPTLLRWPFMHETLSFGFSLKWYGYLAPPHLWLINMHLFELGHADPTNVLPYFGRHVCWSKIVKAVLIRQQCS